LPNSPPPPVRLRASDSLHTKANLRGCFFKKQFPSPVQESFRPGEDYLFLMKTYELFILPGQVVFLRVCEVLGLIVDHKVVQLLWRSNCSRLPQHLQYLSTIWVPGPRFLFQCFVVTGMVSSQQEEPIEIYDQSRSSCFPYYACT
jgi:hypothetical protein